MNKNKEYKITIIIPSHERPWCLHRLLTYYSEASMFNVVVIDSSKNKFKYVKEFNIEYYYIPEATFNEKIKFAANNINIQTDYILICPDDDYIIMDSILTCCRFLDNNEDYCVALGNYLFVDDYKDAFNYIAKEDMVSLSIEQSTPIERFLSQLNTAAHWIWGVTRKEAFLLYAKSIKNTHIENPLLAEHYHSLFFSVTGKLKVLDLLYMLKANGEINYGNVGTGRDYLNNNKQEINELGRFCAKYLEKLEGRVVKGNFLKLVQNVVYGAYNNYAIIEEEEFKTKSWIFKDNLKKITHKKVLYKYYRYKFLLRSYFRMSDELSKSEIKIYKNILCLQKRSYFLLKENQ